MSELVTANDREEGGREIDRESLRERESELNWNPKFKPGKYKVQAEHLIQALSTSSKWSLLT